MSNAPKMNQKPIDRYATEKNKLYRTGQFLLTLINDYVKEVEDAKMTNEAFFINWEDSVNTISVKDHADSK